MQHFFTMVCSSGFIGVEETFLTWILMTLMTLISTVQKWRGETLDGK